MTSITDIDLLILGKTGNGKSALGNAILKRKEFFSISSTDSVTTEVTYAVSEYKNKIIKVVDVPGVGDTRLDTKENVELVASKIEQAILTNPRGYHAFLIVVRFGGRFTKEEQDVLRFLRLMFGPKFVQQYCILVMTWGDHFERESEETQQTFEQWYSRQKGVFRELLTECKNRIVLFDNLTKDEVKRDAQIDSLLETISHLQAHGFRYTNESFEKAATLREKALVESKKPLITEEILQEISLILQKLNEEKANFRYDKPITPLEELSARCDKLIENVKEHDKGTGTLEDLKEKVKSLKQSVDNAILVHGTAMEERKKMEEKEEIMVIQMDKKMQEKNEQAKELQKQMSEDFVKQREHYERQKLQDDRENELMRREFERKSAEIEIETKVKIQALEADFQNHLSQLREQAASERSAELAVIQQSLADAEQNMQVQAQNLNTISREEKNKISAAEVMMKGLGCAALVVGHVLAPEVMAVMWLGSAAYAAYQNK